MKYRFEDIITEYIKDKKISAETFGKMLKVKPEEVKKWLIGMNLPDWKKRNEILRTIQCPVNVTDGDGFVFVPLGRLTKAEVEKKVEETNRALGKSWTLSNKMAYYESEDWKKKSEARMKIDNYKCVLCGCKQNLTVHHVTYIDFGHENEATQLVTVCESCHQLIHSDKKECIRKGHELLQGRKSLVLMTQEGKLKVYNFTEKVSDSDIKKFLGNIEKKYGVKYKHWAIADVSENDLYDTERLKKILK